MTKHTLELATFAAGCFWGVQEEFDKLKGVKSSLVGYAGGPIDNPTYEDVGTGKTGHAESIQVEYDPADTSYKKLLEKFFEIHDPTTMNRQGVDIGTQYRSAIFYHTPDQDKEALAMIKKINDSGKYSKPIVTEIKPVLRFFKAEEYHQKYYIKHPGKKVC